MTQQKYSPQTDTKHSTKFKMFRDWLTNNLGIGQTRKEQVYLEISKSVSLKDVSYWIQVLFSAGIATLGLVLDSPAVIIGAMLISPLMGSILANGLALAAGDVILAMRASMNLALSCFTAISFATLLVWVLPFKEMSQEILARTSPNLLDLVVALFSGGVGSLAICKEPKGAVTSIPGVAIAVALMPPLCVVGYGIGIAFSLNFSRGLQVASGGGLLFFTNLVAITFTAMLVFLALHIDSALVKQQVRGWRKTDPESAWMRDILEKLPASRRLRKIGSLPGRFLLIFITITAIFVPLNQSFSQLKRELYQRQQENDIRLAATKVWEDDFGNFPNGDTRSFVSKLSAVPRQNKLLIQLQVFTSKLYTPDEQSRYVKKLASRLRKNPESIKLKLIEIPTASNELLRTIPEEKSPDPETIISVAKLHSDFIQEIKSALTNLRLPSGVQMLDYEIISSEKAPLTVRVIYLSDRDVSLDAQDLLKSDIQQRFDYPEARFIMQRIDTNAGQLSFKKAQSALNTAESPKLDKIGQLLQQQPNLQLQTTTNRQTDEPEEIQQQRFEAIAKYLADKWKINNNRILNTPGAESQSNAKMKLVLKSSNSSN
ncbi:MAG: DUF389 domain-containing protein [Cyanobacteria bacterium P01_A01_bin.84]